MSTAVMAPTLARLPEARIGLSGAVYGALLNHRAELESLGDAVNQPPYKAAPRAPVLAVMPRHMHASDGSDLVLPADCEGLEVGVALGLVIGRVACRVPWASALSFVSGYLVLGEVTLPMSGKPAVHYRPGVRLRARDGFCPLGPRITPAGEVTAPDSLAMRVWVGGELMQATTTGDRLRGVAQLVSEVSEFMTLQVGDVLSLGRSHGAPLVRAGQRVVLEVEGLAPLHHRVVAESVAS
jgi:5-oxopent-3-ene-1,2,5-tricarboxylate decarboxylase/2-hydroxyhepta-2,4-diene-1,7-dioate isomerase